jgi:hypothetical protein
MQNADADEDADERFLGLGVGCVAVARRVMLPKISLRVVCLAALRYMEDAR